MKVVKLHEKNREGVLSQCERILRRGGAIVGPSDTVYGIYANAFDKKAVKKIFDIKKRPPEKALSLFVKDISSARKIAYIDDRKARFLEKVWPGAATVIFYKKDVVPDAISGGKETVGLRMPNNNFLLDLLRRLGFPLAETSANISGNEPARSAEEGKEFFKKEKAVSLIVDGGELARQPSTVIDFSKNEPIILRSGVITKKELDEILKR